MRSPAITIRELSFLSGYSVSTVSKALNNKLDISRTTRETIKAIAKQHNYIPNNYAVSLRVKRTQSIAVILPDVTTVCYNQSLCQIQKSAEKFGYRILFYQSFNSYDKELNYIKTLNDGSVEGVIIIKSIFKQTLDYNSDLMPVQLLEINMNQSPEEVKSYSNIILRNLLKD
jgi:LacI family transcriptional regulator